MKLSKECMSPKYQAQQDYYLDPDKNGQLCNPYDIITEHDKWMDYAMEMSRLWGNALQDLMHEGLA